MVVVWVVEGRLSPRIALLVTLFDTMERGITDTASSTDYGELFWC